MINYGAYTSRCTALSIKSMFRILPSMALCSAANVSFLQTRSNSRLHFVSIKAWLKRLVTLLPGLHPIAPCRAHLSAFLSHQKISSRRCSWVVFISWCVVVVLCSQVVLSFVCLLKLDVWRAAAKLVESYQRINFMRNRMELIGQNWVVLIIADSCFQSSTAQQLSKFIFFSRHPVQSGKPAQCRTEERRKDLP